jgi:hypothetical protein
MANDNTIYTLKVPVATLTNPTSASTFVSSLNSAVPAAVYFPVLPSYATNAAYKFVARGRATTAGSYNVTPKVSYGVSVTAASNTVIAAATARACATTTTAWLIQGVLFWDVTSLTLKGYFTAVNGSTATIDSPAVTTTKTSVDLRTSGLGLTVELTIATGGTGYLDELSLEAI